MDITTELARQGLGYLLFTGSVGVIIYQQRAKEKLHEHISKIERARVDDIKEVLKRNNKALSSVREGLQTVLTIIRENK